MADALLDVFRQEVKQARKQQKSDDIITFMRKNWKLFCSSKQYMDMCVEELVNRHELSVTALADSLGLPKYVMFKKVKVIDTAKTLLHFKTSSLYKLFCDTRDKMTNSGRGMFLCLFVVAGDHTMVITNLTCRRVPGLVHMFVADPDNDEYVDINIMPSEDLPLRLPTLFNHEE